MAQVRISHAQAIQLIAELDRRFDWSRWDADTVEALQLRKELDFAIRVLDRECGRPTGQLRD